MSELISVICTVKNGENTIVETINSVLNQTYKNLEFVIIDDGSTDETFNILDEFRNTDNRVKLFSFGELGRGSALNKAIELCKGNYIANIDADDLFHPQKLELQYQLIKQYPEALLVCSDTTLIFEDENKVWEILSPKDSKQSNIESNILYRNQISHITVLFNKNKLIEVGKYSSERKSLLDYELWLRSYYQNYKMIKSDLVLAAKRIHKNQSFENKKRLKYTFNILKLQIKYIVKSKKYLYYLPIPIINFLFAQLPFAIRNKINTILN